MQWHELRSHIRHLSAQDLKKVEAAFLLGKSVHSGQRRKSGEPYFNHPVAVAHMLIDLGADRDTVIAALLHDTVEDTSLTIENIEEQFNGSVTTLIDGLTKLDAKDLILTPKLDTQIETLRKMFTLMQQDVRIMVIKLVDRLHNMQTVEFLAPEKQKTIANETLEVYVKIADKLCMQDMRDELEGLCYSVLDPALHEEVLQLIERNELRATGIIADMKRALAMYDPALTQKIKVGFERKIWDQLIAQAKEGESIATGLSFISLTFVCEDVDMCYHVMGTLHQHWKREVLSFQDYINAAQLNGYQGLHTTIILQNGTRVRCKIRTKEMQNYARQGISSKCFDNKTLGIDHYLPWVNRISPLTEDTEGSSTDFWENLKSDILGEFIVIHGPDDTTVQLPKDATALDAAFYLFQEHALRTKTILMNGIETSYGSPLLNGASIGIDLHKKQTCELDWLKQVKTGFATAKIREILGKEPIEKKIAVGKEKLQKIMTERNKGLLDEFDLAALSSSLERQGLSDLSSELILLAEGKREPQEIYNMLFVTPKKKIEIEEKPKSYTVHFSIPKEKLQNLRLFLSTMQKNIVWKTMRMKEEGSILHISFTVSSTQKEIQLFKQSLIDDGVINLELYIRTQQENYLIAIVIVLWALNPVLAQWFLIGGMAPITLITIRLLTLCLFMTFFFVFWRICTTTKFTRTPHMTWVALPSSLANAGMMIYIYALQSIPPVVHLTLLRFNTLLLPAIDYSSKQHKLRPIAIFTAIIIATIAAFYVVLPNRPLLGMAFSCATLIFYTLYSVSTERTLQQHKIDVRYPYFLFHSGLISGAIGLFLVPWLPKDFLSMPETYLAMAYVIFCICVTQILYSAILKTIRFKHFTDLFLIEVPIAMLLQYLILGISMPFYAYVVITVAIGAILAARWRITE